MSKVAQKDMIISLFEQWSPRKLALDKDPGGLMIGTLDQPVQKVLTTLDVTEAVVDEAIEKGVDLIIAHHPLIFKPLTEIDVKHGQGPIIEKCIKHDITVYAAHTNLDAARGGVNDMLAEALGLQSPNVLVPTYEEKLKKLVVFVPQENVEEVRQALGDAGAGHIGDYSHCTYGVDGTGTFIPGDETNPHIGTQGELEFVDEKRMETVVPVSKLPEVLQVLTGVHPYEEPAYDIYPVELPGEVYGLGRIGQLASSMTLEAFAEKVKEDLNVPAVRVVGPAHATVERVAVLGGDGNKFWPQAQKQGADVYVTGDIYFHTAQDAQMEGLNMVDPGHHVEAVMKEGVQQRLQNQVNEMGFAVEVLASQRSTEPFRFQ
ncbi:dinuclear metal center YbgI/SA1388 family protein [Salsuginibacillus halophilus]|uniref:GTP cyclohydrolase 1 type 2 homolog n=1 Tax=Salsuginibacillus halophilus TaxID=517424 RepID=A0A2P8HFM7_9BACI|nr:Nif3-like dinuclear metal center hexameric protein [Salsuginibacillus halophilus]PSL45006.1 dinuclear metal center YbgI/SA1388 family protein [Salsuginibacillus halophilus]